MATENQEVKTDERPHVSVSSNGKRKKGLLLIVAVAVVALVFVGGILLGRQIENDELNRQIGNTNTVTEAAVTSGLEVKLLNETVKLSGDSAQDQQTLKAAIAKIPDAQLQSAPYDKLIEVYAYAKISNDEVTIARVGKVISARKASFDNAQQRAIQEMGL